MEAITTLLFAIAAVFYGMRYFSSRNRKLRKIPGPPGYPIVGNAFQMDITKQHETIRKWAGDYGHVFKVNIFGEDVVVANSYEAIKEVMLTKSNDFAGRPVNYRCRAVFGDEDMTFYDMNPKLSYMKKAAMTGLKQVGDQVTELEGILQASLDGLTNAFTKLEGKVVNVRDEINEFVNHITYTLVFGRPVPESEHNALTTVNWDLNLALNPTTEYASLDNYPFLRGVWYSKYRDFMSIVERTKIFYTKHSTSTIEDHNGEIRCALDGMIKEMQDPSAEKTSRITFGNIMSVANNLTAAGVNTTNSALYYLVSLLAANPDIQEEAYEHIIESIGRRPASLLDRFSIPYVDSMIIEVLRLMSQLPICIPHKTLKDTTLQGYEIPKGIQIWPNLWHLHHDELLWDDPWEFKPKRFLDEDGNLVKADHPLRKQFYGFGAGRRVCVGENLAKHRMFLFIVSVIQKFRFAVPEEETILTDPRDFEIGFALRPVDYNIKIKLRH